MIIIDIEIKTRSKAKEFSNRLHDTLEDVLFSIVQKLPESLIPPFIMNWLDRYTDKCIKRIQEDITRQKWQQIYLEKAIEEIHAKQDKKKAP